MDLVERLRALGVRRGDLVGLAVAGDGRAAVAAAGGRADAAVDAAALAAADAELRPRWVIWSADTALAALRTGWRPSVSWDLAAVHRLLAGGWRAEPGHVWALVQGLEPPPDAVAHRGQADLFSAGAEPAGAGPVGADGHLARAWVDGAWRHDPASLAAWAALALDVAERQQAMLAAIGDRPMATTIARSESTAELLCAELATGGLPIGVAEAERIIAALAGPRPRSDADADRMRAERDALVLRHALPGTSYLLRNPGHVRSLLRSAGIEVPDTRAWRLDAMRGQHPLVDDLLAWRKAERIATTFGYPWLDAHVGPDGRLRGEWTGSDGAAGRMTATAGLHNLPADLRPAVAAEPGHVFVRADLGQIEPRVLAAVTRDPALAAATRDDDLYAPIAAALGVDRATAKVAVLGAMYGQTTGHGAHALQRLEAAYPVAMRALRDADVAGQVGRDLRTYGGRLVRLGPVDEPGIDERESRRRAAARGRYARNATIQGAAAELFKMWAVIVRSRLAAGGCGEIVLCLHDELLVHVPRDAGGDVAAMLHDALHETAARWAQDDSVRFVVDVAVVDRWSDAKG